MREVRQDAEAARGRPSWQAGRFLQLGLRVVSQLEPICVHGASPMRPQETQVPRPPDRRHSCRAPGNGGDEIAVSEPGQCAAALQPSPHWLMNVELTAMLVIRRPASTPDVLLDDVSDCPHSKSDVGTRGL